MWSFPRRPAATHGSLAAVLTGHGAAIRQDEEGTSEAWWRVITACQYGLEAAIRVSLLLGAQPLAGLVVRRRVRIAIGLTPRCWASKRIVSEPTPSGVAMAMASTTRSTGE